MPTWIPHQPKRIYPLGGIRTGVTLKVNCDIAIPRGGGEGKLAVVIRDWKGKVLDGLARSLSEG